MSPYDPYGGGWVAPSWWQRSPGGWAPEPGRLGATEANALGFLNAILPMMRTQQDVLGLARYIGMLSRGRGPGGAYARATTTTGEAMPTAPRWPSGRWEKALGSIVYGEGRELEQQRALGNWLKGLWGTAQQYGMTPAGPGKTGATREQQRGFQQAFGQALKTGPAGAEMYAPWMQKLFMPSVSRPMPGQYQFDPQTQRWQVQRQPRFY